MQINITRFFTLEQPSHYSASRAELGDNAGGITRDNALRVFSEYKHISSEDEVQAFKQWVRWSGGWSEDEINTWTIEELNALFIQWVSGDMRDAGLDCADPDWEAYDDMAENGQCSSNIWQDENGVIYFSLEV